MQTSPNRNQTLKPTQLHPKEKLTQFPDRTSPHKIALSNQFSKQEGPVPPQWNSEHQTRFFLFHDAPKAPLTRIDFEQREFSQTQPNANQNQYKPSQLQEFLLSTNAPEIKVVSIENNEIYTHDARIVPKPDSDQSHQAQMNELIEHLSSRPGMMQQMSNEQAVKELYGHLSEEDQDRLTDQLNEMELRAVIIQDEDNQDEPTVIFLNAAKDPFAGQFQFKPLADEFDESDDAKSIGQHEPIMVSVLTAGAAELLREAADENHTLEHLIKTTMDLAQQRVSPPIEGITDFAPSAQAAIMLAQTGKVLNQDQFKAVASTGAIKFAHKSIIQDAFQINTLMDNLESQDAKNSYSPRPATGEIF